MVCKEDILVELEKKFSGMISKVSEPYGLLTLEVKKEIIKEMCYLLFLATFCASLFLF